MGEIHEDEKIDMIDFVAGFLLSLNWFPNVLLLRGARRRDQPVVNVTLILRVHVHNTATTQPTSN